MGHKMKAIRSVIILLIIVLSSSLFAANDLSIKDNTSKGSKPGYIQKATLVIEPFGGYCEESLYLEYTDNKQFTSNLLEIVHRFELPAGSVINDMWLWIGDSVMQAKMYDTWTGRHLYDSIVATKYDPAYLAKTGSQYELRVYPLATGSYRKVKITFIVPTKWSGNQASAEFPLKMLLSNNSLKKPLEVLFRTQKDVWGDPTIAESPQSSFIKLKDSLNYHYKNLLLNDISGYSSLNLNFTTGFTNGTYTSGYQDKSDSTYFQLGILPKDFFNVTVDNSSHNILVALDFSGSYKKDLTKNLASYQSLIQSSLKPNDSFKLLISGNNKIVDYTNSFLPATTQNITNSFSSFQGSDYAKAIDFIYMPGILFCDRQASINWNFNNLSSIAHVTVLSDIVSSMNTITKSDVVAAYDQGFESPLSQSTANQVIGRLDSLFANGGRFLTYYDYNREGKELLATHYITGLHVKMVNHNTLTLYNNPNGNIGMNFPESFTRNASYFFEFNDPDVKIELMDQAGNPAVISKKIKNGLIVVTGIWSLNDDDGMKAMLGAPLLGVNSSKNPYTLDVLLSRIKQEYTANSFTKAIILSDSDSLISKADAITKAKGYIASFGSKYPKFLTVNLLDNSIFTPGYIVDGQTEYYGSGYYLNQVSNESNGIHMEKHLYDLSYIANVFSPYTIPLLNNLTVTATADDGAGSTYDIREVNKLADPNKPRFFIGLAKAHNSISFNITGRFDGADTDSSKKVTFLIAHDTTTYEKVVSSMLGSEKINDYFSATPVDTSKILKLSLKYNLLTDYTSLLALEPNDKNPFLKHPTDESGFVNTSVNKKDIVDSTVVSVYPNPFNSTVTIRFNLKSVSKISGIIYNILGQKVNEVANFENASGIKTVRWYGKNNFGSTVSSGFYILRVIVTDKITKKESIYTNKLIYLK